MGKIKLGKDIAKSIKLQAQAVEPQIIEKEVIKEVIVEKPVIKEIVKEVLVDNNQKIEVPNYDAIFESINSEIAKLHKIDENITGHVNAALEELEDLTLSHSYSLQQKILLAEKRIEVGIERLEKQNLDLNEKIKKLNQKLLVSGVIASVLLIATLFI